MPTFKIEIKSPFNFDLSLDFCRRSRFELIDQTSPAELARVIVVDNTPVLIKIMTSVSPDDSFVEVHWRKLESGKVNARKIEGAAKKILSADLDLKPFYNIAKKDKRFATLIDHFYGLKPVLTPTVFESSAWAIIGQQVNLSFAFSLKNRLVQNYGRRFKIDGQVYYTFPDFKSINRIRVTTLRKMQFSQRKAEYLLGLSKLLISDNKYLDRLGTMTYDDAVSKLISIRGLGEWSANYILMRGVGHADCLPVGDSGLTRAIREFYGLNSNPDNDKIIKLAGKYRPHRSLFTLYLWFYLMEDKKP